MDGRKIKNRKNNKNEIIKYMDRHGVFNKDIDRHYVKHKEPKISDRKKSAGVLTVDLHGKTKNEAKPILHRAFETGKSKGYGKLLIIHGKGNNSDKNYGPVIKRLVHSMLKNEFYNSLIDFRIASPKDGGEGATTVLLR